MSFTASRWHCTPFQEKKAGENDRELDYGTKFEMMKMQSTCVKQIFKVDPVIGSLCDFDCMV